MAGSQELQILGSHDLSRLVGRLLILAREKADHDGGQRNDKRDEHGPQYESSPPIGGILRRTRTLEKLFGTQCCQDPLRGGQS
ncbi:MAG TPA: hypothetical protein VKU80_05320, partial [Planctomycetota bacterium]|nr:hypothetical protein [Planctomycetota bacterium]